MNQINQRQLYRSSVHVFEVNKTIPNNIQQTLIYLLSLLNDQYYQIKLYLKLIIIGQILTMLYTPNLFTQSYTLNPATNMPIYPQQSSVLPQQQQVQNYLGGMHLQQACWGISERSRQISKAWRGDAPRVTQKTSISGLSSQPAMQGFNQFRVPQIFSDANNYQNSSKQLQGSQTFSFSNHRANEFERFQPLGSLAIDCHDGLESRSQLDQQSYHAITTRKRLELLQLLDEKRMRIKEAAHALNINYQTAKSIIRRYRATGKITRTNRILKQEYVDQEDSLENGCKSQQFRGLIVPQLQQCQSLPFQKQEGSQTADQNKNLGNPLYLDFRVGGKHEKIAIVKSHQILEERQTQDVNINQKVVTLHGGSTAIVGQQIDQQKNEQIQKRQSENTLIEEIWVNNCRLIQREAIQSLAQRRITQDEKQILSFNEGSCFSKNSQKINYYGQVAEIGGCIAKDLDQRDKNEIDQTKINLISINALNEQDANIQQHSSVQLMLGGDGFRISVGKQIQRFKLFQIDHRISDDLHQINSKGANMSMQLISGTPPLPISTSIKLDLLKADGCVREAQSTQNPQQYFHKSEEELSHFRGAQSGKKRDEECNTWNYSSFGGRPQFLLTELKEPKKSEAQLITYQSATLSTLKIDNEPSSSIFPQKYLGQTADSNRCDVTQSIAQSADLRIKIIDCQVLHTGTGENAPSWKLHPHFGPAPLQNFNQQPIHINEKDLSIKHANFSKGHYTSNSLSMNPISSFQGADQNQDQYGQARSRGLDIKFAAETFNIKSELANAKSIPLNCCTTTQTFNSNTYSSTHPQNLAQLQSMPYIPAHQLQNIQLQLAGFNGGPIQNFSEYNPRMIEQHHISGK
ncbi:hypothetical protein FGO68_gene4932 [Halteria grandinella]|uniref:Insertion element IS150 protein InsJ-like helix-turn-helix domain-containing protein n=1 Tax=Halteria grandinella TaxID=5974 RepID=A0A8J8P177_HALGN|nr:hypothetical protein FGO68_gene4932 [Halteria grandinella]